MPKSITRQAFEAAYDAAIWRESDNAPCFITDAEALEIVAEFFELAGRDFLSTEDPS